MSNFCIRCNIPIKKVTNLKYCPACKRLARAEQNVSHNARMLSQRRSMMKAQAELLKAKPPAFKSSISDAEQLAHDQALNKKYDEPTQTVIYKPGTAAFKRAAQEIIERRRHVAFPKTRDRFNEVSIDVRQHAAR